MNKWEKQVQQSLLRDEQQVLRILKKAYESVLADIDAKIGEYAIRILTDEEDTAAIYQLRHQQALREQVEKIIGDLHWKSYDTIHSYLEGTYENGFIGAMYSIHKQGIPLLLPLNQQNIVRAVTTNSKISVGLYTRLGKDIDVLKTIIAAETTRGIATSSTWHETAVQIRAKGQIPYYNAIRIARTEGHRVQCEGQMDACQDAKAHGADMVKQWDAALDKRTRPLHRQLDGQIRELEEPFEIAGYHAMQPGAFDAPEMDIHCRCAMLQRARWALDEEELETLKERAEYYGLDKTEQFEDFKRKYLDAVEDAARNQPKTLDFSGGSGIIELRGNGSIYHEVIDKSIKNVPKLEIFETDDLNVLHQKASRDLLREVSKQKTIGTEVSIVYGADMQPIEGFGYRIGKIGTVGVDNPRVAFHAFHNHGSGETFSMTDLNRFVENENMLSLSAIGNTGSAYNILRTASSDSKGYRVFLRSKSKEVIYSANGTDFTLEMLSDKSRRDLMVEAVSKLNDTQIEELKAAMVKQGEDCAKGGVDYGFQYKFRKAEVADG